MRRFNASHNLSTRRPREHVTEGQRQPFPTSPTGSESATSLSALAQPSRQPVPPTG